MKWDDVKLENAVRFFVSFLEDSLPEEEIQGLIAEEPNTFELISAIDLAIKGKANPDDVYRNAGIITEYWAGKRSQEKDNGEPQEK